MENNPDSRNRSILSQSYMERVKRLSGNSTTSEDKYEISEEQIKSRERSWSWLFKKFSKFPDVGLLNILTLQPDTDSSGSHGLETRIPVRKSTVQLQHWIDTGNSPWQAMEMELETSDTNETVSISESEAPDSENSQPLHSTSMIVNRMLANSRDQLIATGSSASSVDTATYILQNGKSGRKTEKDGLTNMDNNIVGRSINSAVPRVVCTRLKDWPKKAAVGETNSPDVDEERKSRSRVASEDEIVSDKNISHKTDQACEKKSKNEEIKDSEVTFESKESGIGSSGVENMEKKECKKDKKSSSTSEESILGQKKSACLSKRKLFTRTDTFFDLISPTVKTVQQIKLVRKSFHPALDSPSTCGKSKTKIRPRVLTMARRKSRSHSMIKRNRNKFSVPPKSRVLKNRRSSCKGDEETTDHLETRVSLGNENPDPLTKISAVDPNEIKKNENHSKDSKSSGSSLSCKDVSLIINEELNKTSETLPAVVLENNRQSFIKDVQRSENKDCGNDQGSIFKPLAESSSETKESRMQRMRHVKKNLCATDLQSSGETDSPNASSSDFFTKNDEDDISDASTILLPESQSSKRSSKTSENDLDYEKLKDSAQFNPILILHDFLDLKDCCREVERENNKYWLRDKNKNENFNTDMKGGEKIAAEVDSNETNSENMKSKKAMNQKVPVRKRLKLENKAAAHVSKHNEGRILRTRNAADLFTDDSRSSEEKPVYLRAQKPENNRNHRSTTGNNSSQDIEASGRLRNEGNTTITFTNTNHNRWASIFILTSSDEEDPFKKLNDTSKTRSLRKKTGVNDKEVAPSIGVKKNETLDESEAIKSYKIVSSTSEDEKNTVSEKSATRSKRMTRKYSKRNKLKDSRDSELTTRCPKEDECGDRSEGFKTENEKLEKQSPGVNKRSERKIGKQQRETGRDYLVAQSKVNNEIQTDQKSRSKERARRNSDGFEVRISGRTKDVDRVLIADEINVKQNFPKNISKNLIKPVDRVSNSPEIHTEVKNSADDYRNIATFIGKSGSCVKRRTLRKIWRAAESSESEAESDVGQAPDHKDRRKSSTEIDDSDKKSGGDRGETFSSSSSYKLVFDDESSDNDDAMTLYSNNYAGDNYRDKKNRLKDGDPDRPNKRGTFSKENINRHGRNSSKIIFRTKEYWESDSDNT